MAGGIGGGEHGDTLQNFSQVDVFQAQIAGTGEVDQDLHDAVEAVDFVADDVHVAAGFGIVLLQLVLQQLEVEDDGVDGVFHFVSDATGEASAGGKAAGNFNFVFDAAHRFGVAHGQQGANLAFLFPE